MKQAEFQVEICKQEEQFFSHGMDQIRFLIKTNVGNDFKPLVKLLLEENYHELCLP